MIIVNSKKFLCLQIYTYYDLFRFALGINSIYLEFTTRISTLSLLEFLGFALER